MNVGEREVSGRSEGCRCILLSDIDSRTVPIAVLANERLDILLSVSHYPLWLASVLRLKITGIATRKGWSEPCTNRY